MPMRVLPLLALCCILLSPPARALDPAKSFHHYVRDTWSLPEGMPQSSAVAMAQTPDGYLWVATQGGLARFDGTGFTTFTPTSEPALPHPLISALEVDGHGDLWIGTRGGMSVLRGGRFHAVPWTGESESPRIYGLHLDDDGTVWAATHSGLARVDDGSLHPFGDSAPTQAVTRTSDGTLWSGGGRGASRWDGGVRVDTHWHDGEALAVYDLLEVDGELWAATARGLYVHGRRGWRPLPGSADKDPLPLRFLYRDSDGNVWSGGDLGLVRVRPGHPLERIRGTRSNGLSNLFSAFEDREGNLWLGSLSGGLNRLWNGWTRRYSTEEGLPDATVWTLTPGPDGDGIWVGTNNGLARLGGDGRFTLTPTDGDASGAVHGLFAEPGRLWYGLRNGLALYEPGSGRPASVPDWARDVRGMILGFSRDHRGHLWIGGQGELMRWDGSTLQRFGPGQGLAGTVAEPRLITLRDGRLLALTRSSLLEFDGTSFAPAPESLDLPADVRLSALTELDDGRLLLSSFDELLLLRHQGRWHSVGVADGLLPGIAFQVVERAGTLWISGMHGAYRLSLDGLTAYVEGRAERLVPEMLLNEHSTANGGQQGVCCNGSGPSDGFIAEDTLWLPTRDGVIALDTTAIAHNRSAPQVHISRLQVGDEWQAPVPGTPINLDADQRDLILGFDVLSYQDPRGNRARYRLTGYDQAWHAAAPMARQVRYTNLPPGDYVFEVIGSNNADVWTSEPARLHFSIQPWFHETLAFRLLLGATAMLLVWAGYRYQRYRFRARQEELETLVGERTAALAESNHQLEQASFTDPLTGLRNRRYLAQQLPADLDYYERQFARNPESGDIVVFALADLDGFKQINDRYGHLGGDRVLEETSRRLRTLVRAGDYVVRWGGEEFLLVFRPMPAGQVAELGERLCSAISATPFDMGDDRQLAMTVSVGLAEYPLFRQHGSPLGWEAMVELADQALYHVKRNGRDGWAVFRPTATTRMDTLLADLQRDPEATLREGRLLLAGSVEAPSSAG